MKTLREVIESGMSCCNVYDGLHNYITNTNEVKKLIEFYNNDYKNDGDSYKIRISDCHMNFAINRGEHWCDTTDGSFRITFDGEYQATFDVCFTITNNCRRRWHVSAMRHKQMKKANRLMWRNAFK